MIPSFDQYENLPPGIHVANVAEIRSRFVYNAKRKALFVQLQKVLSILKTSNCLEAYLNGSYITNKKEPGDYDLCWEPTGIKATRDIRKLLKSPDTLKQKFLGDISPCIPQPPYHLDHVTSWQMDIEGNAKGIIKIILRKPHD